MEATKKKTHFACALIWDEPEPGRFTFIVQFVTSTKACRIGKPQLKFPGGIGRINCRPEETPELTAQREILEETHLAVNPASLERIWEMSAPPDSDKPNEEHMKYGFLTPRSQCRGELRKEVLRDNGDTMEVPFPMSVEEIKSRLFSGHQAPFIEACRRLGIM